MICYVNVNVSDDNRVHVDAVAAAVSAAALAAGVHNRDRVDEVLVEND